MKKVLKYLGRTILAIVMLLVFIVFLLYFPPVQNLIRKEALKYVASHYGLVVKLEHFRLSFPLNVELRGVYVGHTEADTLASAETLRLDVGLKGIFKGELSVDELAFRQVNFGIAGDTLGTTLKVAVGTLDLKAKRIDWKRKLAEVSRIAVADGRVMLDAGESSPDTAVAKPIDWTISVGEIDIREIAYQMKSAAMPYLNAGVKSGRISGGEVSLAHQMVDVDSLEVDGAWCRMQTAAGQSATGNGAQSSAGNDTQEAASGMPWTVTAGTLQMMNSAFSMGSQNESSAQLVLSGIGVRIDSVYNRGTEVKAVLKDLQAVQKDGIRISEMQADIGLDSSATVLEGAYIRTAYSVIRLNVHADTSVQHLLERVPLRATLDARIGLADIAPFYKEIPESILQQSVQVNTTFSATGKRLLVGQLIVSMPGHFRVSGSGRLSNFREVKKMSGNFTLRGELPDIRFAREYLQDAGITIPTNMDMLAHLKADRGKFESLLRLCCGDGCLTLDGSYRQDAEDYDAELNLNRFPLNRFLPQDSLGAVTAVARLEGKHFSWAQARAQLELKVRQFFYNGYDYENIAVQASLDKTRLQAAITSEDPAVPLDIVVRGDSTDHAYIARLTGIVGPVNLQDLNFVTEPLQFSTALDVEASLAAAETYGVELRLDSLKIADATHTYRLGELTVTGRSDLRGTKVDMLSGDLALHVRTDTSLMAFVGSLGTITDDIRAQVEQRDVDMEALRQKLPVFDIELEAARNNAVARFLNTRNIGFRQVYFDAVSRKRNGIRVGFQANAPYFGSVRLDSVQFGAWQTGKSLVYSMNAGSSSEAWKGLFNVNISGRMQGDRLRLELRQKDAAGKIGFDLGVNLVMQDSAFTVSFFPMNPILGYGRWIVNADNRITVWNDWKVNANLRMAYMNKLVNVQSLEDVGEMKDRLQVEIQGIELEELSRMVPFMPELKGELNTDILLYSEREMLGVEGSVGIAGMVYRNQRIGSLDLRLQYSGANRLTDHTVAFELKIDSLQRAVANGKFSTSETKRDLMVDVGFPGFPLYIVNAFLPADVMKLSGDLTGNVKLRGTVDEPLINGEVAFRDGKADMVMIGTKFSLDPKPLTVKDGNILFDRYRFIAPNNSDMVVNGNIALTPFDRMNMNLSVKANNFEVVNVKKNDASLIYGKAYANVDARMNGEFSDLKVTGNVNLLNSTSITYTLRNSDPSMVDKSVDLVRFVSFRDTTLNEKDELTNRVNSSSFSLRMLIEIGDQVRAGVDLSEDGSNHVNIQGGGNLVLAMNPESGMTLSGKYILTGGTVEYSVPIVGKKEFSIRSGSFVEWTGNVLNPVLSISASEQVKANVEDGEQSRQVVFEAIIKIQNTLSHPDITFDLSAPNDMVVQNQLATFSPEERTRQALNLLIYNTYTAPGAAKSGNSGNVANNAIYSFVENELNKYTRKAGLTVGFDSHNTEDNIARTDVTYQFSRQLFNDRVRVKIGGRISTDSNEGQSNTLQDNLVDDISIEYVLTRKRNLYVKVFRHSNYESVLDGEVTQTGVGIVWRKNFRKFKDLFKNKNREERKMLKENKMQE